MTGLSDERINQLLKEAESRLTATRPQWSEASSGVSSAVKPDLTKGAVSQQGSRPAATRKGDEKLAVRDVGSTSSKQEQDNAGPGWFGMPRTDPADKELKRSLQFLQMRGTALDSKRHYKKDSLKARVPRYAHTGRIVEGPTDFFSARLTRKERKKSLVDELLAAEKESGKFKSRYQDIQARKSSGKKAFYKKLVAQRRGHKY